MTFLFSEISNRLLEDFIVIFFFIVSSRFSEIYSLEVKIAPSVCDGTEFLEIQFLHKLALFNLTCVGQYYASVIGYIQTKYEFKKFPVNMWNLNFTLPISVPSHFDMNLFIFLYVGNIQVSWTFAKFQFSMYLLKKAVKIIYHLHHIFKILKQSFHDGTEI